MNPSCEIVAPVFSEYRSILIKYITSKVKDPVESEEILSEVMMKIYDHCEKVSDIKNVEAWLITIARNTITDFFRGRRKEVEFNLDITEENSSDVLHELEACVPSLIDKLPEKYALPLKAYELEGVSQKDLAVQFNMSESGMKSRVQRGRTMLKTLFQDYCGQLVAETGCGDCKSC